MKTIIRIFTLLLLLVMHKTVFTQAGGVTFITGSEWTWTAETKPTTDGNLIALSGSFDDGINQYKLTKLDLDGDVIWSNDTVFPDYGNYNDIFSLEDGSFVVFNGNHFLKFNSVGELTSFKVLTPDELGYDPIPEDIGTIDYGDVLQIEDGFIYISQGSTGFERIIAVTKLDENGNSIWSYAYILDIAFCQSATLHDGYLYLRLESSYIENTNYLYKIDTLTGSIVSETEIEGTIYYCSLLNTGTGILEFATFQDSLNINDLFIKYDYEGDTSWIKKYEYTGMGIGDYRDPVLLESGNIIQYGSVLNPDGEEEYIISYYNSEGDSLFRVNNFLEHEPFKIKDMQLSGENLIFSGQFNGLDDVNWGFVLITDTLGNFFQLVINGHVYYDENTNGVVDDFEYRFHDRIIYTDPPVFLSATNSEGEYYLHFYEEGSYTITTDNPEYWDIIDPAVYTINFEEIMGGDTLFNTDFRLDYTIPITDLSITVNQQNIRPGFPTSTTLTVESIGNQIVEDATAYLNHPSGLNYTGGTPYTDYTDTTITWSIPELVPNEPIALSVEYNASPDLIFGDHKLIVGSIEPVIGDFAAENNIDSVVEVITGPYDPNHKTVDPAGFSEEGYIDPTTEWLEYTIEFQNIGNAPANFVNIVDVIDNDLDLTSIQILGAKHNYWMEITGTSNIIWHFENINLPDSASDPLGSCGFITYKIKINEEATVGTVITNTAFIYFDYNDAVVTNTTKTTLELPNSVQEFNKYLNVYPNPAGDHIIMQLEEENTSGYNIKIYNINGEVILDEVLDAGQQMIQINSANFPNGIYFINCSDVGGIFKTNAKFIVAH
ncbi:MAG: T9SS type A sorting domain-containing protein [Bacteroidetes bacterium]|nr:T9SS type A sorting domain-containing protein [Bacteroidota bacterium]